MTFTLSIIVFCSVSSFAEYRVYKLGVKYHPENPAEEEKELITTLDDLQYHSYYKSSYTQQTRLISHWMCRGRTDWLTAYCLEPPHQSPPLQNDFRAPASVLK